MRKRKTAAPDSSFEEATINLTPLIDVVFVVLIIFIIIAPMLELDRVELAQAASTSTKKPLPASEQGVLAIHVHADNTIWFNGKKVEEKELTSLLKDVRRAHPRQNPQLFQDRKACFGTYQTVKNAVETAGFEELDIVLKPG